MSIETKSYCALAAILLASLFAATAVLAFAVDYVPEPAIELSAEPGVN